MENRQRLWPQDSLIPNLTTTAFEDVGFDVAAKKKKKKKKKTTTTTTTKRRTRCRVRMTTGRGFCLFVFARDDVHQDRGRRDRPLVDENVRKQTATPPEQKSPNFRSSLATWETAELPWYVHQKTTTEIDSIRTGKQQIQTS